MPMTSLPLLQVMALVGAGISAESGIPTFRGPEGYWTAGSRHYAPTDLATWRMFQEAPETVWAWYLHRRRICRAAKPNAAHRALVDAEKRLGDRWALVTQNVDGLNLRAGSSPGRTFEIHGNIDLMRCSRACSGGLLPVPDVEALTHNKLGREARFKLQCHQCGAWTRPHVLWFDEAYDEANYRLDSALTATRTMKTLVIAGTLGATSLPNLIGRIAHQRNITIYDVNIERSPFSGLAEASPGGAFLAGRASVLLPRLLATLVQEGVRD